MREKRDIFSAEIAPEFFFFVRTADFMIGRAIKHISPSNLQHLPGRQTAYKTFILVGR